MEKPITPPNNSIYRDAARSYVSSEIEKIESILNQNFQRFIQDKCRKIKDYLNKGIEEIEDHGDLLDFKGQLNYISPLIDLFLTSSESKSAWWALPLIKECYQKCGIKYSDRNILIVHHLNSYDYSIKPDLLRGSPIKALKADTNPVDAFIIPSEAKYDVSSIALIGHEVGHIYWEQNFDKIHKVIEEAFQHDTEITSLPLFDKEVLREKRVSIAKHIEEFLCDKIGRFLLGPAFDFALLKYFIARNKQLASKTHPPEDIRKIESLTSLKQYDSTSPEIKKCLENLIEYLPKIDASEGNDQIAKGLAEKIHSSSTFNNEQNDSLLTEKWNKIKPELDAFRPPFEKVSSEAPQPISPIDAVIIASLYYYGKQYQLSNDYYIKNEQPEKNKEAVIRSKLVEHLRYAISIYDFVREAQNKYCGKNFKTEEMSQTLWQMRDRRSGGKFNSFVVTPSINPKSQYSVTSVDLRLGSSFLIHKTTGFTHINPEPSKDENDKRAPLDAFYDELFIPPGKNFILHPHQFVLAATLEYVSIPFDYYALVLGRSSWGRLGLNIATATTVNAGYRGCITLELRNLGETPLPLKVGIRVAQLCLIPISIENSSGGYFVQSGKYIGPVGPEIPKIKDDDDWDLLCNLKY
jgi:dCTP deaminase